MQWLLSCTCSPFILQLHCDGTLRDPNQLARRIAERLIAIGDGVNADTDTFTVQEILETFVTSFQHNQGVGLTWGNIGQLYRALSNLLTSVVYSGGELESNEAWLTFNKLWKRVLQALSAWITQNGGWVSELVTICLSETNGW